MSISKPSWAFLAALAWPSGGEAHYWCHADFAVAVEDSSACPAPTVEIFYLPDSIYFFAPPCGKLSQDYNGHCDLTNTVTYSAKGYYSVSGPLQDLCNRVSLGAKPPPEPIAKVDCKITLRPGPLADAGPDHAVRLFTRDTLDAGASLALPGRPIAKYLWRARLFDADRPNPGTVVFSDSTSARPSYIPIVAGDYRFFVRVDDGQGSSAWDTVKVHVCRADESCPATGTARMPSLPMSGDIRLRRASPARMEFQVPAGARFVSILDAGGRLLAALEPRDGKAVWDREAGRNQARHPALVVIAQMADGGILRSSVFRQ